MILYLCPIHAYQVDLVLYRINGKVDVDRLKLRNAIEKDVVDHPREFASAEARDLKSDLEGVLPAEEASELIAMLRRAYDRVKTRSLADALVSLYKIK